MSCRGLELFLLKLFLVAMNLFWAKDFQIVTCIFKPGFIRIFSIGFIQNAKRNKIKNGNKECVKRQQLHLRVENSQKPPLGFQRSEIHRKNISHPETGFNIFAIPWCLFTIIPLILWIHKYLWEIVFLSTKKLNNCKH